MGKKHIKAIAQDDLSIAAQAFGMIATKTCQRANNYEMPSISHLVAEAGVHREAFACLVSGKTKNMSITVIEKLLAVLPEAAIEAYLKHYAFFTWLKLGNKEKAEKVVKNYEGGAVLHLKLAGTNVHETSNN